MGGLHRRGRAHAARALVAEAPARPVPAGAVNLVVPLTLGLLAAWLGRELGLRF